ncbi:MAG: 16S rRNA (uracil(1498)-N(3))-methyltransferase [Mycobacteriales bacterium]
MTPPVFLIDALPDGDTAVLSGPEGHHAATVRRIVQGERVWLADGAGGIAECDVASAVPERLELIVVRRAVLDPPDPAVVVAQAVPKGDRGELAVELMTELGVDEIIPWAAARCVAKWRGDRVVKHVTRWRGAARTAAKQARRAFVPTVTDPVGTRALCARVAAATSAVVLHEAATTPLVSLPLPTSGELLLVVGPEGGLSDGEITVLRAAGAQLARLGSPVLRTSTAGAAALAAVSTPLGRWP